MARKCLLYVLITAVHDTISLAADLLLTLSLVSFSRFLGVKSKTESTRAPIQ